MALFAPCGWRTSCTSAKHAVRGVRNIAARFRRAKHLGLSSCRFTSLPLILRRSVTPKSGVSVFLFPAVGELRAQVRSTQGVGSQHSGTVSQCETSRAWLASFHFPAANSPQEPYTQSGSTYSFYNSYFITLINRNISSGPSSGSHSSSSGIPWSG